jgi:hypothetical protein
LDHGAAATKYTLPVVQKLFSMFPRGASGLALLLLRWFAGAQLATDAVTVISGLNVVLAGVLVVCVLAIVVGLATPIAATLAALIESIALSTHFTHVALLSFAPIVIAVAVALLGPGAWSIDARLFGRRLMEFGPDSDDHR